MEGSRKEEAAGRKNFTVDSAKFVDLAQARSPGEVHAMLAPDKLELGVVKEGFEAQFAGARSNVGPEVYLAMVFHPKMYDFDIETAEGYEALGEQMQQVATLLQSRGLSPDETLTLVHEAVSESYNQLGTSSEKLDLASVVAHFRLRAEFLTKAVEAAKAATLVKEPEKAAVGGAGREPPLDEVEAEAEAKEEAVDTDLLASNKEVARMLREKRAYPDDYGEFSEAEETRLAELEAQIKSTEDKLAERVATGVQAARERSLREDWGGNYKAFIEDVKTSAHLRFPEDGTYYDVEGDGACGVRCLAVHRFGDEDRRQDLQNELAEYVGGIGPRDNDHPLYHRVVAIGESYMARQLFYMVKGRAHDAGRPADNEELKKYYDEIKGKPFAEKRQACMTRLALEDMSQKWTWLSPEEVGDFYAHAFQVPVVIHDGGFETTYGREYLPNGKLPVYVKLVGGGHWNIRLPVE